MARPPDEPVRDLTEAEIARYREDGVVCLRTILPPDWVDRMAQAIDATVADPPPIVAAFSRQHEGFTGGIFLWKQEAAYHDFLYHAPTARIAARAMGATRVNAFFDHLFVKEPGCFLPTPWHQDLPYWPLKGTQICTVWAPFDPVSQETSGLEFVAGSHKWPQDFKPQAITKGAIDGDISGLEDPPDIEAERDRHDIRSWDMEPGDVLLFHGRILHGAGANASLAHRRRALATRWSGDDITWDPRPWKLQLLWDAGLAPGDPLGGPLFPQILPVRPGDDDGDRFPGPDLPPQDRLRAFLTRQARARPG